MKVEFRVSSKTTDTNIRYETDEIRQEINSKDNLETVHNDAEDGYTDTIRQEINGKDNLTWII